MSLKLQQQLKELGSKLESLPPTKDSLIKLLKQAVTCLSELAQSPSALVLESMQPLLNGIVKQELLRHQDRDVKLLIATCICEITRITAPEAPYSDAILKDTFHLIVSTFSGLSDTNGPSFGRRVVILESLARYRSCVVMLDLECDDLVKEMFSTFFSVASDDHPETVLISMQKIMVVLLEESEDVPEDLLLILLSMLGRNKKDVTKAARKLAMNVIGNSAGKLEPGIKQFILSSMSGDRLDCQIDHLEVIYDIYQCAPQILSGVVPYLTGELLTDQLESRLKTVKLVGDLFALPGPAISESFHPIFLEFLKRLTDRVVEVRMSVLEHVKTYLLSDPFGAEASQIISALCDRLLDYDENVRKQVVAVLCDVACHNLKSVAVDTVKLVAERLRDKSLVVKNYTMERLAEIYRLYCSRCSDGSENCSEFDWIPGKILRCYFDKDFRSDTIESILCGSLYPSEFTVKDIVKHWIRVFSGFDKVEVKVLEKILEQKQRLQQEMQRYLTLRQMHQDGDTADLQKKVLLCFRSMSRWFTDPAKAEEGFQVLDQLKDANIWKILATLLDPASSFHQASTSRDGLFKILSEKHRLYEFLNTLSMKCSYILFSKDHVRELLLEASSKKSSGNAIFTLSCMNILVILARFCPLLLSGTEEDLVNLLKDENDIIKEGVLHILAKAGGTIREQLAESSSSIDLMLERLCIEGSRRQAKYAVHALAAITKDDGLKSLSVLYKRLVDMLKEKTYLPAVLQSLGCIAQAAMPVFETRESEIEAFIKSKVLECSNKTEDHKNTSWDDRSELCSLKIFGIKTLVKSYLPVKDANLRQGIDGLLQILKHILTFGEVSKDIKSSLVDRAHLQLASAKAVLRLSKNWDHKIPADIFHLTLRAPEIRFPQAKKLFLNKVHQYIKDRLLDAKYACAFLYNMGGSQQPEFVEENKNNLGEIIQICYQAKGRQLSPQSGANSPIAYPEYILPYVVHSLSHHSCPNIDECKDVKAFELVYRQLHLFLSMLIRGGGGGGGSGDGDGDGKPEASTIKEKESVSAIISIFRAIKCSEDAIDRAKSRNSHGICDLGLAITKRLAQIQDDLQPLTTSVSLPSVLYKPHEKKEGDDSLVNEGQTWLADETALAHLESLKLEVNGKTVHSEIVEDEIPRDSDNDGNEIPLGKMIKRLKSRKVVKDKSLPAELKNSENDFDVLKMVREINLDNLGEISKLESNGHRTSKFDKKFQKRKRRNNNGAMPVPVPKRRRSSSSQSAYKLSLPKGASKGSKRYSNENFPETGVSSFHSMDTDMEIHSDSEDKPAESDLLVSCIQKNLTSSGKGKSKDSGKSYIDEDESHNPKEHRVLVETDVLNAASNLKSAPGSTRKRRSRSVAGLAKCTSNEDHTKDLTDCRIQVWWPLDKQFYQGIVKSYDPKKKRHEVLYDDGDVEFLNLEKERWELVDNFSTPPKSSNSSKRTPARKDSTGQKKVSGGLQQDEKSTKTSSSANVRRKRTPRKNAKKEREILSESKIATEAAESRGDSGLSNAEPAATSNVDGLKTGEFDGELVESEDNHPMGEKEINEDKKSFSEENLVEETEEKPKAAVVTGEEAKPDYAAKNDPKTTEVIAQVLQESHPEDKQAEEDDSNKQDVENPVSTKSEDVENSDSAPLIMWKLQAGKSVRGK